MKFTETRSKLKEFAGATTAEYQMQYITSEVKDVFSKINDRYVDYLSKDITENEIEGDIKGWLGNAYYGPSNSNAKECLEICLTVKHIYGRKIKTWTDNALKCYDNLLLKYIQEDRKELIGKTGPHTKERDVYQHLIKLGGEHQEIGQCFDFIYSMRNEFQHVQIVTANGYRIPRNVSNKKYNESRDLIVGWFKKALVHLDSKIN